MIAPKIREQVHTYLHAHKAEILSDLETLVRIPSVRGESLPEMPYGKACADALSAFAALCGRENIPVSAAETAESVGFPAEKNWKYGFPLHFSRSINSLLNIFGEDAAKVKGGRKALPVTPQSEKKMEMGRGL